DPSPPRDARTSTTIIRARAGSLRPRQVHHHVVLEPHEPVQLSLEDPFLIAVGAETFRAILRVQRRPDAIALYALGPNLRFVARPRAHRRQHVDVVMLLRL